VKVIHMLKRVLKQVAMPLTISINKTSSAGCCARRCKPVQSILLSLSTGSPGSIVAADPVISYASEGTRGGETLLLTGESFRPGRTQVATRRSSTCSAPSPRLEDRPVKSSNRNLEFELDLAGPGRMRHLEQVLANQDHLPALTPKARAEMGEPARG